MESTVSQETSIEPIDAETLDESREPLTRSRPFWRSVAEVVVMLAILLGLFNLLTADAELNGSSMSPTLNAGQRVLASRVTYDLFPPTRGDVVALADPFNPSRAIVLRVIGLPGEQVELRGQQVLINSQPLNEDYLGSPLLLGSNLTGTLQLVLPPDQYFVLGDNRLSMTDSRTWGPVPASSILGRVWLSYWPPDNIALIQPAHYEISTER